VAAQWATASSLVGVLMGAHHWIAPATIRTLGADSQLARTLMRPRGSYHYWTVTACRHHLCVGKMGRTQHHHRPISDTFRSLLAYDDPVVSSRAQRCSLTRLFQARSCPAQNVSLLYLTPAACSASFGTEMGGR